MWEGKLSQQRWNLGPWTASWHFSAPDLFSTAVGVAVQTDTSQCEKNSAPPSKSRLKLVWNNVTIHLDIHRLASLNMYAHNSIPTTCDPLWANSIKFPNLNQHHYFLGGIPWSFSPPFGVTNPAVWSLEFWPQPTTINLSTPKKNPRILQLEGWGNLYYAEVFFGGVLKMFRHVWGRNRILRENHFGWDQPLDLCLPWALRTRLPRVAK